MQKRPSQTGYDWIPPNINGATGNVIHTPPWYVLVSIDSRPNLVLYQLIWSITSGCIDQRVFGSKVKNCETPPQLIYLPSASCPIIKVHLSSYLRVLEKHHSAPLGQHAGRTDRNWTMQRYKASPSCCSMLPHKNSTAVPPRYPAVWPHPGTFESALSPTLPLHLENLAAKAT